MKESRIIFFGTPAFSALQLSRLLENGFNVVAVVTSPDKPAGRGLQIQYSEVKKVASRFHLPILQPVSLKDEGFLNQLRTYEAEVFVVIAFRMLPPEVWKMPILGTFNVHASLLPDYRGAAPINWAIVNGETETGLTTFFLNERIDEGSIILQHKMSIGADETAGELHDRMADEAWPLLQETLRQITTGDLKCLPQDHSKAIHKAPKINRDHLRIVWNKPINQIINQIRGFSPKPGAFTLLLHQSGKNMEMRILKANILSDRLETEPCKVLVWNKQLVVNHPDGLINLLEVQLPGKNVLKASEFIKGFRDDGGWKVR